MNAALQKHWALARARAGWPAAVALLAGALAAGLGLQLAPRWQAEAGAADTETLRVQRQLRDRILGAAPSSVGPSTAAPLPAHAGLPPADATAARTADLMALAIGHGVLVERMQLRDGAERIAPGVVRLTVVMPVRAGYADLRRFIAQSLHDDSALALDRVRLRRPQADAAQLDADLQWALLHDGAATPATAQATARASVQAPTPPTVQAPPVARAR